jgi:MinD superfamily P-loop ATPase
VAIPYRAAAVVAAARVSDPLGRPEPSPVSTQLRETAAWFVDLLFERVEPRPAPEPIAARACRLATGTRVAFCSLIAGCGVTTLAALAAQRAGGAGSTVRLLDLDLVAPTLALLAGERTPTLLDALSAERFRGRKWGSAHAVFGAERDPGAEIGDALSRFVRRASEDAAVVVDAGALSERTVALLRSCDVVAYVTTTRAAHVHAATRALPWLRELERPVRLVVNRAQPDSATAVASELGLTLASAIPEDPFLARDEFRVRAETAREVDRLLASLR